MFSSERHFLSNLDRLHQDRFERMGHDRFCFNVLKYAQIVCGRHDYRWIVTEGGRCRKYHVRYVAGAAGRRWLYGGAHLVQLMVVMCFGWRAHEFIHHLQCIFRLVH
uniref:Uncharacterized protein n=1 Tax=Anopheles coluzzii TaxID=1518534 RepID=A0A8W7PLK1_ANOCL